MSNPDVMNCICGRVLGVQLDAENFELGGLQKRGHAS